MISHWLDTPRFALYVVEATQSLATDTWREVEDGHGHGASRFRSHQSKRSPRPLHWPTSFGGFHTAWGATGQWRQAANLRHATVWSECRQPLLRLRWDACL